MSAAGCRIDVWLWRARFAKTRTQAAAMVERGVVRMTHNGAQSRVDKASRCVHVGDRIVFAKTGRLIELTVAGLGERRGPPVEARALYETIGGVDPTPAG